MRRKTVLIGVINRETLRKFSQLLPENYYTRMIKQSLVSKKIESNLWVIIQLPKIEEDDEKIYFKRIKSLLNRYLKGLEGENVLWSIEFSDLKNRIENLADLKKYKVYLNLNKVQFYLVQTKIRSQEQIETQWITCLYKEYGQKLSLEKNSVTVLCPKNQNYDLIDYIFKNGVNLIPKILPYVSIGIYPKSLSREIFQESINISKALIKELKEEEKIQENQQKEFALNKAGKENAEFRLLINLQKLIREVECGQIKNLTNYPNIQEVLKEIKEKIEHMTPEENDVLVNGSLDKFLDFSILDNTLNNKKDSNIIKNLKKMSSNMTKKKTLKEITEKYNINANLFKSFWSEIALQGEEFSVSLHEAFLYEVTAHYGINNTINWYNLLTNYAHKIIYIYIAFKYKHIEFNDKIPKSILKKILTKQQVELRKLIINDKNFLMINLAHPLIHYYLSYYKGIIILNYVQPKSWTNRDVYFTVKKNEEFVQKNTLEENFLNEKKYKNKKRINKKKAKKDKREMENSLAKLNIFEKHLSQKFNKIKEEFPAKKTEDIKSLIGLYLEKRSKEILKRDILLLPPKAWKFIKKSTENFTGIKENNQDSPLLTKHFSNKHEYKMKNKGLLDSINKFQNTPYKLNREVYSWIFSSDNKEYIDKDAYEKARLDYKNNQDQKNLLNKIRQGEALKKTMSKYFEYALHKERFDNIERQFERAMTRVWERIKEKMINVYNIKDKLSLIPKDSNIFYFPTGIDFRGRAKSICESHPLNSKIPRMLSDLIITDYLPLEKNTFFESFYIKYYKNTQDKYNIKDIKKILFEGQSSMADNEVGFISQYKKIKEIIEEKTHQKIPQKGSLVSADCPSSVFQITTLLLGNGYYAKELGFLGNISNDNIYEILGSKVLKYLSWLNKRTKKSKNKSTKLKNEEKKYLEKKKEHNKYATTSFCISLPQHIKKTKGIKQRFKNIKEKRYYVPTYKISKNLGIKLILDFFNKIIKKSNKGKNIEKKLFKSVLMTSFYGAGMYSVEEKLEEIITENLGTEYIEIAYLIGYNIQSFLRKKTSLMKLSQIIKEIVAYYTLTETKLIIPTPFGETIIDYRKEKSIKYIRNYNLENSDTTVVHSMRYKNGINERDKVKQNLSIAANIVQGLDATLLHLVNLELDKYFPNTCIMQAVHDSVTTSSSLLQLIKRIFCKIAHDLFYLSKTCLQSKLPWLKENTTYLDNLLNYLLANAPDVPKEEILKNLPKKSIIPIWTVSLSKSELEARILKLRNSYIDKEFSDFKAINWEKLKNKGTFLNTY